jgi:cytochrome c peroxidase
MKRVLICTVIAGAMAGPPLSAWSENGTSLEAMKALYVRPSTTPYPASNPYSPEKARLGEMLFFDPRISGANYVSCATCHNPALSWGDGMSKGHGVEPLGRRTPTILNLAYADLLMWDGRKADLEEQALGPMGTPAEMNTDLDHLPEKLASISGYRKAFAAAFPNEGLTLATIAKAIATFERTVVSGPAPFDRWIAGDETAISDSAKRGFVLFNTKGKCAACHSGWNFTDGSFRDIGLPDTDRGRAAILPLPSMEHAFKTPTLRDVARRGPYMHDGSIETLAQVVEHYDRGGVERPSRSEEIKPLHLSAEEKRDLVEFMVTLTGDNAPTRIPVLFAGPETAHFISKQEHAHD